MENKVQKIKDLYSQMGHPIAFGSPGVIYNYFKKRNEKIPLELIKKTLLSLNGYITHIEKRKQKYSNPFFIYLPDKLR